MCIRICQIAICKIISLSFNERYKTSVIVSFIFAQSESSKTWISMSDTNEELVIDESLILLDTFRNSGVSAPKFGW